MAYQSILNPMPVTGTLAVTGTFYQATQPVSLASTTITGSVAVTGAFFQATQPVSITTDADTAGSGTIAALNATVSVALNGKSAMRVQITGTWVGTLQFEGTVDGTNWIAVNAVQAGSTTIPQTTTTNGMFSPTPAGFASFRVNATAWTSGTATVSIRASAGTGGIYHNQNLPGFQVIPAFKIDQTTPGTTNLVQISGTVPVSGTTVPTGASGTANTSVVTIQGIAGAIPVPISGSISATTTGTATTAAPTYTNATSNPLSLNLAGGLRVDGSGVTQPVSIAALPALTTGAAVIGALTANQSVNVSQMNGVAVTMGSGVTGTGVQRVVLATDVALPTGANVIGKVGIDQTTPGTTNLVVASQIVGANSTTGDTGAKTANGNGATQTNVGNKGVQVLIVMGPVAGTTPTFVGKLQGSVDGGTTWYDIPGATTASLVATGVFGITVYPSATVVAGTTTTGTTAAASQPLPRTWRVAWTIGGTTPSFTITNVQFNYLAN